MKRVSELIKELENYPIKGSFSYSRNDTLSQVCNIPTRKDYSGIYLFYDNKNELIYVGISGRENGNGEIIHRKDGLRGRFLKGKQFGDRRSKTLSLQMGIDGISRLDIKWFVTYGEDRKDIPRPIENKIILTFKEENNGNRPKWNNRD